MAVCELKWLKRVPISLRCTWLGGSLFTLQVALPPCNAGTKTCEMYDTGHFSFGLAHLDVKGGTCLYEIGEGGGGCDEKAWYASRLCYCHREGESDAGEAGRSPRYEYGTQEAVACAIRAPQC